MMRPKNKLKDDNSHKMFSRPTYWGEYHRIFTQKYKGWLGVVELDREPEWELHSVGITVINIFMATDCFTKHTWAAVRDLDKRFDISNNKISELMKDNYCNYI